VAVTVSVTLVREADAVRLAVVLDNDVPVSVPVVRVVAVAVTLLPVAVVVVDVVRVVLL